MTPDPRVMQDLREGAYVAVYGPDRTSPECVLVMDRKPLICGEPDAIIAYSDPKLKGRGGRTYVSREQVDHILNGCSWYHTVFRTCFEGDALRKWYLG